ncbi:hypothetical protein AZZ62_005112, partial [Klebsiella variicola]
YQACTVAGSGRGAWLAIPAKALSSRAWCRTIAARSAGVNPPSSSQAPSEVARPSSSAAGIASGAIWATMSCSIWAWRCQAVSKACRSTASMAAGSQFQRLCASRCRPNRCHGSIILPPLPAPARLPGPGTSGRRSRRYSRRHARPGRWLRCAPTDRR